MQGTPQAAVEWRAFRVSGQDALAVRASKKLRTDELLVTSLAGTRLRMELGRVPLWRSPAGASANGGGDHVAIKQLVEDFARYLYLPRIKEPAVLVDAIRDGLGLLTWSQDSFAYADNFDEAAGRYRGLRCGQHVPITETDAGLLVRPEIARKQKATHRLRVRLRTGHRRDKPCRVLNWSKQGDVSAKVWPAWNRCTAMPARCWPNGTPRQSASRS